ncbi:MAG: hypothetical protein ACE5GG_03500 [Candidatus Omnitrophota bacterium]
MTKVILGAAFFVVVVSAVSFAAEDLGVEARIEKIEQENYRLRQMLSEQADVISRLKARIDKLENAASVPSGGQEDFGFVQDDGFVAEEDVFSLGGGIAMPRFELRGFSDIEISSAVTPSESNTTFSWGALDLFLTSELTQRLSFLAEMEFHPDKDTNSSSFHLERSNLKYSFSDLLNIKVGRMHTALGYWNQAYHHGTWLQTTISRPDIYEFEDDDGGFLPVHSVGLEFSGMRGFDGLDLEYNLALLNGRGRTVTEIQNGKDKNDSKAVNLLFSLSPHNLAGLKFGGGVYYDSIPADPGTAARAQRIVELITGGYISYVNDETEFLWEVFHIAHRDKTSGNDFGTLGFYLQGGYKIGKGLMPYYRFDFVDVGDGDPYFSPNDIDIRRHTLGLRWDVSSWNALKFEYGFVDKKGKDDEHRLTLNSSFAF